MAPNRKQVAKKDPAKKTKDVAVRGSSEIALPSEMNELMGMGDGFESITQDDLSFPFLKIAQPTSSQVMEDDDSYIEGLKPGHFFNTVTNARYGKELDVVIIGYYQAILMWGDELGDYKGQISPLDFKALKPTLSYEENDDGKMEWTDGDGTKYVDTRTYFVILPDYPEDGLMMFSLSSTGITHSKKWITKTRMVQLPAKAGVMPKTAPIFTSVWRIGTKLNKKDSFRWFQIGEKKVSCIERIGWVPGELVPVIKSSVAFFADLSKERVNFQGAADGPIQEESFDDEDVIDQEEPEYEEAETEDEVPDFEDDF